MKNNKIPVDLHGWLDYQGKVYIIESNNKGDTADYQYDGVSCLQGNIKGFVVASFESKLKWFNPDIWYTRTVWSTKKEHIFFHNKNEKIGLGFNISQEKWKMLVDQKVNPKSTPCENIIKAMIEEVFDKTKLKLKMAGFNTYEYGDGWYEARIPVEIDDKMYLLTWENCD